MAVELNFNRNNDSIPWGFRLTGGADLDLPITVIKVTENSIAEDAGMKVGDMLVRVGDTPTAGLTHLQVHDLIKVAGNIFVAAVIRGELPAQITESEETIDSQTTEDGISKSVQINIKANVVDTTEIVVESGEIVEQDIRVNGTVISDQEQQNLTIRKEENKSEQTTIQKSSQQMKTETSESVEVQTTETKDEMSKLIDNLTQPPEFIKDSEVLKVINEEKKGAKEKMKMEKRWTTFLQKPDRPKPKIKPTVIEEPKEPPYKVIIQKQKKKRDEEKARFAEVSQETTPVPAEMLAETPVPGNEGEEKEEIQRQETEMAEEEEEQAEVCEQTEEPVISEVELSLEEQLAAIQKQLLALSQLPAAIQQTLDVVTQQLTKIVGPVNDPNSEENETEDYNEEDTLNSQFDTDEFRRETGDLETLEEVSESGLERDSQQGDENQERDDIEREDEFDKPESELEMLQATPEPEEDLNLTPEEREARRAERQKVDKQQKIAHWNDIWPWGDRLGRKIYRDANTHLVPSKAIEANKINFLKYQPPPKTLDHLKHSEVYRLIHDMDEPARGVGARGGKAMAEEDYYAQARQEGQMKG